MPRALPTSTTSSAADVTGVAFAFGTRRRNRGASARVSRLDHTCSVDAAYPWRCANSCAVSPRARPARTRSAYFASVFFVAPAIVVMPGILSPTTRPWGDGASRSGYYATTRPGEAGVGAAFGAEFTITFVLMLTALLFMSAKRLERHAGASRTRVVYGRLTTFCSAGLAFVMPRTPP